MRPLSLRSRLRWMIISVVIVVLLPLGLFSYTRTLNETEELLDGRLTQSARTLDVLIQNIGIDVLRSKDDGELVVPVVGRDAEKREVHAHTHELNVGYQVFDMQNRMRLTTANLAQLPIPKTLVSGFESHEFDGFRWRIFTLVDQAGGVVIRMGERDQSRHDIAHALSLDLGLPQ